jgi:signal transduction histidine kinase
MSQHTMTHIFEPFYTTKEIGGTGLGLWISDEIVQRHQGSIKVRSTPRRGTVFQLFLPLKAAETIR